MSTPGHNNPPAPTPLEQARELLSLLDLEAAAWFDGKPITSQEHADDVAKLIDEGRKAKAKFDADRKVEKAPHDTAAKAVDAAWKPLITDAERIIEIGKKAQTPWLIKQEAEKRAAADAARVLADAKTAEARRLASEADGSLAAAKARDAAIADAKAAERVAMRAGNDKAGAKGVGMARTIGLRTTWRSVVEDRRALLNYIAARHPEELTAWLEDWAAGAVRSGTRQLPGVRVYEERQAA